MKLIHNTLATIRPKGTAVLSVMGIVLAIALALIVPVSHCETASNDSIGMAMESVATADNQRYDPEYSLLPSPNYCCATIVAEIAAR